MDLIGFACAVASVALAVAAWWPGLSVPGWPAVTMGAFGVLASRYEGHAAWRGAALFVGALGALVGLAEISLQWGVFSALP